MKTIEIIVSPDGDSKVQTMGFAGKACQLASQFLEAALGSRTSQQLTTEFYQADVADYSSLQQEGPPFDTP